MKTFTKLFGLLAVAAALINAAPVDDIVDSTEKTKRSVPSGYNLVFSGLTGATESPSYLTYKMLPTYSEQDCTNFCESVTACVFANLYIEHNAQGTFNKCSLFSQPQTSATATNKGQWRDGVLVTISNSNGYLRHCSTVKTCGSFVPGECGQNGCFCFRSASGRGECGDGVTYCYLLKDCNVDADCGGGSYCAVQTCCGKNVCVSMTCPNPRMKLARRGDLVEATPAEPAQ